MKYRQESDSMGTLRIPEDAYYGAQTQRAVENFNISGQTFPPDFIHMLALVKKYAARANRDLSRLDEKRATAIETAAGEVADGKLDDQFVVDIFQTGSGTSTNMNANEVIASRANEILTGRRGGKSPVHPNDHVNLGQSSNDVIPTVIHITALAAINSRLVPALERLHAVLVKKTEEFKDVEKIGRTHLQDAVPMTMGEVFSGYARQVALGLLQLDQRKQRLAELALGGTAIGTGANTHAAFAKTVIAHISRHTGTEFVEAENHFEAQAARDAAADISGVLKTIAGSLAKIANDIRLLGSGPRCGIGELILPALQPGSSIMPGKVNPVIPEAVIQVAYQVMGNDTTIMLGVQGGLFELNTNLPVICQNLLQSISLLSSAADAFSEKCLADLRTDDKICKAYIEKSLALVTALVPHIGYDRAAQLAKKAYDSGKTIREIAKKESGLSEERVDAILASQAETT